MSKEVNLKYYFKTSSTNHQAYPLVRICKIESSNVKKEIDFPIYPRIKQSKVIEKA